jgi:hypothetical protein
VRIRENLSDFPRKFMQTREDPWRSVKIRGGP